MNVLSLVCLGAAGSIHLVLGARLLWLSRRTRGAPELLWGLTWFMAAVENTSDALSGAVASPDLALALRWGVSVAFPLVAMVLFLANWRLFRPNDLWARIVCIAVCLVLVGIWIYEVTGPGLDVPFAGTSRSLLNWANNLAMTIGLIWATLEAWRNFRMFEKRWRLGLVKRLLAFRYLLWAGSGSAMVVFWAILWLNQAEVLPVWLFDLSLPLASLISAGLMWVTFFPPVWLCQRLDQEAPAV